MSYDHFTSGPNRSTSVLNRERVMRVFVSSTFRDMHAERDELIKRIFPQLRKICEERGVTWSEVDLRWGITEEQSQRGEVLPICLAEIHRCRPYFIGLLGERYGWVPEEIPRELIEREPWLVEHLQQSVTELEILHGVLNNPGMADHAFFYFRDRGYVESQPIDNQPDFLELATHEDIAKYGEQEAVRRAEERKRKLVALKSRIRQKSFPVREDYRNSQDLGEMVLADMNAVIEHLYPKGSEPVSLDRDALEHEAFAQSRAKVYIGRKAYYDSLDEHARDDGPPLIVLGESGSGKSALLANWALRYRKSHPEELLLMHFIGATPYSTDWAAMVRRIMSEFARQFGIELEIPDRPDALRSAFANWLHMAAARGRVVLVLDGVNQLEDRDSALELVWLPPEIPSNIRLIVSALPGRALDDLEKRGWPTIKVQLLEADERKQLIPTYLSQYSKGLSTARIERIAATGQTANPLYLRALLDELRVFGVHEKLDDRLEHYLAAGTISELYKRILERYEEDYEREREGLVRETMTLLWAARRGLSETELLELLGTNGGPLPRAHWSPLFLAAEGSLVSRSGLIGFVHDYLRQAVEDKYGTGEQPRQQAHLRLADYFGSQYLGARMIDELPWQLAEAKSWQRLCDLLADPQFFTASWRANEFEVQTYWAKIEVSSSLRMVDAYASVLDEPGENAHYTSNVANLFVETGHPGEALSLRRYLVSHFRECGDRENLSACLGGEAAILYARGELDGALRLNKEKERICRELGKNDVLQGCLGDQAAIFYARGELEQAILLNNERERICHELGDKDGLQVCLNNQALIIFDRCEFDEAMRLLEESRRICREIGNKNGLQACLGNQALILKARGYLDEAMRLHKEEERIVRELGNKNGLQACLGNQALILADKGELEEAMRLHREQERICRELGYKDGLLRSIGNQAAILADGGELDEAMRLNKEQEQICRDIGNKDGLQACLGNQAVTLKAKGEADEAMRLHKEEEQICRELSNIDGLTRSLLNQALLLITKYGLLREALPLAEEAYSLATKHGLVGRAKEIEPILDLARSPVLFVWKSLLRGIRRLVTLRFPH